MTETKEKRQSKNEAMKLKIKNSEEITKIRKRTQLMHYKIILGLSFQTLD